MHILQFFLFLILVFPSILFSQDLNIPSGLKVEIFTDQVDSPRQMAQGHMGTIFVGSRKTGSVFAIKDQDENGRADNLRVIADNLNQPAGVSMFAGDLYIACLLYTSDAADE